MDKINNNKKEGKTNSIVLGLPSCPLAQGLISERRSVEIERGRGERGEEGGRGAGGG